jgi:hypothetical protein
MLFAVFLSGCINNSIRHVEPSTDLRKIRSIFVEKFAPDKRQLNLLIVEELNKMGYLASTGEKQPDSINAVLTYRDKWRWDITTYMLSISMKLNDPDTNFPLAYGQALHTSLTRKTPKEMIKEVLTNIFSQR